MSMISIFRRLTILGAVVFALLLAGGAPDQAMASERSCSQERRLKSQNSGIPSAITFVNNSGLYRSLIWRDYKGGEKSFGGLNPGERKNMKTYAGQVWVVATGPGDCVQIFVTEPRPMTVVLTRKPIDGPATVAPQPNRKCPKGQYLNQNGVCQRNETGG